MMTQAFYTGLSGIRSNQTAIDVTSDNLANISTTGFRGSTYEFASLFEEALNTSHSITSSTIGVGSRIQATSINQGQGILELTDRSTDLAILGEGWFGIQGENEPIYTRDGAFTFDVNDDLVSLDGLHVLGTMGGNINDTTLTARLDEVPLGNVGTQEKLRFPKTLTYPPEASTFANFIGNISVSDETFVTATPFSSATPKLTMTYSGGAIPMDSTDIGSTADTANSFIDTIAQVSTQTVSTFSDINITDGTLVSGQTISGAFDGKVYSYTVKDSDVDEGSTSDELMTNIATQMASDLKSIASSVTWDATNQEMVVTALTPGIPFSTKTPTLTMTYRDIVGSTMDATDVGTTPDTANVSREAVAQTSTQKFDNLFSDAEIVSGAVISVSDTISGTFDGTEYSYTILDTDVDAGSTRDDLMRNVATQMTSDLSAIAAGVTWDAKHQEMTVTALTPGTPFSSATPLLTMTASGTTGDMLPTDIGSSADRANEVAVKIAQVSTQTVLTFSDASITSGTFAAGQTISGTFDDIEYSYTIQASDVDEESTSDEMMAKVAAQMATDLDTIASSVTWDSANQEMVITAHTPGTVFTPPGKEIQAKSMSATVIDSLGNKNELKLLFTPVDPQVQPGTQWNVVASTKTLDGTTIYDTKNAIVTFDEAGALITNTLTSIDNNGTQVNINIGTGYTGIVSVANSAISSSSSSDGSVGGELQAYTINQNGEVIATFTNGEQSSVGKIAVYHFQNDQGLTRINGARFQESSNSGRPLFYQDADGNNIIGTDLVNFRLEGANIDMTYGITELIILQRSFDANSKSITTADQMMQKALNMDA